MLTIENNVLVKCDENATEVVIPADITEIESDAFEGCKALKTLRFPKDFDFEYLYDNLNPYDMRDENELYYGNIDTFLIDSLTDVYYEGSIADWIKARGYLFFKENVKIHCSDGDAVPLTPDMEKIVIPNGVTEIPDYAFFGYSCKEIEIPDSVTEIGQFALCNTFNLKSITLPASLKYIWDNAFQESGIGTINFKGTKEQWEKISKDQPWGTYRELREWMVSIVHCSDGDAPFFDKDVVIDDNGVVVEPADFFIFDYTIPADVKKIGRYAFDVEDNVDDPRSESDSDFELTYEGTKEQWLKIDKGENWDGEKVVVVHCFDGDIQINKGDKELDEKLLKAVSEGTLEEIKKLIIAGANVNAANDSLGGTALNIALYGNLKEIADFLIKQGSKVNSIYRHIFTSVVERGSKELIELLLTHGVIVNADLGHGRTALMIAASKSNKEMMELLIEHGADVNSAISEQYRVGWDYISVGTTVLMEVVKNGSLEITKLLLEHGADVNAVDEDGWSALTYAVNGGSKELVELLIAHGADINTDCNFTTAVKNKEMLAILLNNKLDVDKIAESAEALSAAVDCSNKEAVELLINHGADVKTTALLNCHTIEIAKLLIDHGADVNVADEHGKTALIVAAEKSNKEMIELLIKHSANVNAADESGYTALMFAAEHNNEELVEFLITHGADVNARSKIGKTALMIITKAYPSFIKRYPKIMEILIEHGADVNAADEYGITPLMIAGNNHNKEVLKFLIDHGADINARSKLGNTPLMCCAYSERNAVTLIELGADVNAVNKQGTSVYERFVYLYGKNSGIVAFLVQHGAKTNVPNLFIEAIKNNNTDEVLKFINNGADLNLHFNIPCEYTPLMVAAQYDSKEVAELLIEHGARVNCCIEVDNDHYYPLSAAAEYNAKNVAEVLLNHGAITDTIEEGEGYEFLRPIDYAIKNNSIGFVEVYLNHGFEIDGFNVYVKAHEENSDEDGWEQEYGADPIAYAEEHNFTELAELLKKHLKKS